MNMEAHISLKQHIYWGMHSNETCCVLPTEPMEWHISIASQRRITPKYATTSHNFTTWQSHWIGSSMKSVKTRWLAASWMMETSIERQMPNVWKRQGNTQSKQPMSMLNRKNSNNHIPNESTWACIHLNRTRILLQFIHINAQTKTNTQLPHTASTTTDARTAQVNMQKIWQPNLPMFQVHHTPAVSRFTVTEPMQMVQARLWELAQHSLPSNIAPMYIMRKY